LPSRSAPPYGGDGRCQAKKIAAGAAASPERLAHGVAVVDTTASSSTSAHGRHADRKRRHRARQARRRHVPSADQAFEDGIAGPQRCTPGLRGATPDRRCRRSWRRKVIGGVGVNAIRRRRRGAMAGERFSNSHFILQSCT
jgi:hypothetical protein